MAKPKSTKDKKFRIRLHSVHNPLTMKMVHKEEVIIVWGHTSEYVEPADDTLGRTFSLLRADGTTAYTNPDASQVRDCVALDAIVEEMETTNVKSIKLVQ